MRCSISSTGKLFRLGGWCLVAAVIACLGLSGCANLDLCGCGLCGGGFCGDGFCGGGFCGNETAAWTREIPTPDARGEFFGLSNSARQIERNLDR